MRVEDSYLPLSNPRRPLRASVHPSHSRQLAASGHIGLFDRKLNPDRLIVAVVVLCLPIQSLNFGFIQSWSLGTYLAVLGLPVILPAARRHGMNRIILLLTAVSVVSVPLLTYSSLAADQSRHIVLSYQIGYPLLLVSGALTYVVILAARKWISLSSIVILYSFGLVINSLFAGGESFQEILKGGLFYALAAFLLLAFEKAWLLPKLIVIGVLIALAVASDSRIALMVSLLTIFLYLWMANKGKRQLSATAVSIILVALSAVGYCFGTFLAQDGVFGDAIQERTIAQTQQNTLILGARPESSATLALFQRQPWGYGAGVVPAQGDLDAARMGMYALDSRLENSDYITRFMFTDRIELHSVAADLWLHFGPAGVCLALVMVVSLLRLLMDNILATFPNPAILFFLIFASWFILFGTISSNLHSVFAAIAFGALVRFETCSAFRGSRERCADIHA